MEISEMFSNLNQQGGLNIDGDKEMAGQPKTEAEFQQLLKENEKRQKQRMFLGKLVIPSILILLYFITKNKLFIGGIIAYFIFD